MQKPFNTEFAKNGDKIEVLENGTATGEVNFKYGFTTPYEKDPQGINRGRDILRGEMNDILNKITAGINSVADEVDKWTLLTTENLNNVTQSGRYYQNRNANATNERNYPVNSAGYLIVLNTTINMWGVTQIYTTWDSEKVYIRRTTSATTWSAWDSLTLTTELNSAVTQLQNAINQKENKTKYSMTDLRNTNLNSVVAKGYYQLIYQGNNTNTPFNEAGFLFVYNYGENVVKQIAIGANNPNNAIYTRFLYNGVWSAWDKFITNTEADTIYRKIVDSYTKTETNNLLNQKENKTYYSLSPNPTLNAVKDDRWYSHGTNYTNAFSNITNYVFNMGAENGAWVRQISFPCIGDTIGVRHIQTKNDMNSWSAWDSVMLTSTANSTYRKIADSYTKAEVNNRTPNLNYMRAGYTRNNISTATFTIPNSSIINHCNITISFRIQQQYSNTITFTFKNGNNVVATKALKRYSVSGQDYDVGDYCMTMCQFQVTSGLRGATITPSVSVSDEGSGLVLEDICFNIQFQQ